MSTTSPSVVFTAEDEHCIIITADDHQRLLQLVDREFHQVVGCKSHLQLLLKELCRASIVASAEVPRDVVTMKSAVELVDLGSGEHQVFTLVYPEMEN